MTTTPVYLFGTCLIDLLYPNVGLSAIQLLEREGVEVIFPQKQSCCGQPAYNSGYRDEARAVALAQLDAFAKPYPVVVPSASCAGMLRHHYPGLFADTPHAQAANELAARVYELHDYLLNVLKIELTDLGAPIKVALHSSCSAQREIDSAPAERALLSQLRNVELVEQAMATECCGFGGTFAVKQPQLSAEMVSDKADALLATGAERLLSGDGGCLMNISGHLQHRGDATKSQHLAEFLWERTDAKQ